MTKHLFRASFTSTLIMLLTGTYLYYTHQSTNPAWYVNWSVINLVMLAVCVYITLNPFK